MPLGSGYSVDAQVTNQDIIGGLQFFITPTKQPKQAVVRPCKSLQIRTLTGNIFDTTGLFDSISSILVNSAKMVGSFLYSTSDLANEYQIDHLDTISWPTYVSQYLLITSSQYID